mmetsp:Transcript_26032/g.70499  ORF Transcript_26032/g.70499 Transcript_26032/m.70499 type:complete len:776 (-) Transcript_26032:2042-4369(-)
MLLRKPFCSAQAHRTYPSELRCPLYAIQPVKLKGAAHHQRCKTSTSHQLNPCNSSEHEEKSVPRTEHKTQVGHGAHTLAADALAPWQLMRVCAVLGAVASCVLMSPKHVQAASVRPSEAQCLPAVPACQQPSRMEVLKYRVLQTFTLPGLGKLLAILAVGMPTVVLGGAAYRQATGEGWAVAVAKAYYVLNKVPSEVSKENRQVASIVLNLIHVASIGTFAVLVGVFTSEIAAGVKAMRQGNFPLPESNHTVVLGWSDRQSIIMLREMIEAQSRREQSKLCTPIVVLSDSAKKAAIDEQLLNEFGDMFNQVIMTRQGSPAAPQDLARVGAGRAGTVIWMVPEKQKKDVGADPGASLSATLTCLHAMRAPDSPPQRLVICEEGGGKGSQAKSLIKTSAGRVAVERLGTCNTTTTRLTDVSELGIMAQVALQPQLSAVFEELCQQHPGQVKFYTISCPELTHKTFKQARKAFPNATLVGMVDAATGAQQLTPSDSQLVGERDRLVLLATDASKLTCMSWKASQQAAIDAVQEAKATSASGGAEKRRASKRQPSQPQQEVQPHVHAPKTVVVLGHGGRLGGIAASLEMFCGPGSKVTLTVPENVSDKDMRTLKAQYNKRKLNGVHFHVAQGNLTSNAFLRKMGVAQADAVVIGDPGQAAGWRPVDADAQVAASILQLQSLMEDEAATTGHSDSSTLGTRGPLSVVSCVTNEKMKPVLQRLVQSARPSTAAQQRSSVQPSSGSSSSLRVCASTCLIAPLHSPQSTLSAAQDSSQQQRRY